MVAHGDDLSGGIEDGAGVITALFDIRGKRSPPQRRSHFLGNRVIEVLEDLDFNRITHVRTKVYAKE
jgi:hypothetical protein